MASSVCRPSRGSDPTAVARPRAGRAVGLLLVPILRCDLALAHQRALVQHALTAAVLPPAGRAVGLLLVLKLRCDLALALGEHLQHSLHLLPPAFPPKHPRPGSLFIPAVLPHPPFVRPPTGRAVRWPSSFGKPSPNNPSVDRILPSFKYPPRFSLPPRRRFVSAVFLCVCFPARPPMSARRPDGPAWAPSVRSLWPSSCSSPACTENSKGQENNRG